MPSAFYPAVGGVEELTFRLATALQDAGETVEVWAPASPAGPPGRSSWSGLSVQRFPMPLPPAVPSEVALAFPGFLRGSWRLWQAAKAFRPDVVHVQCFGPNGVYATGLSLFAKSPLVITLQGETVMDDMDVYDKSVVLRTTLRLALRRAAAVTGCSAFTLRDAERFNLRHGKATVVFNGVSLDETSAPAKAPIEGLSPPFSRYVLAMGRVVHKKGFDLLLKAFSLADIPDDVGLVVGGDGPELPHLRRLAAELGLQERAYFPGRLERTGVAHLMSGAEVFVMPSRLEPFGIVVLEAWRAGTAVVATNRGGPPEFIEDGADGLLVDPLDPSALARAISRLVGDSQLRDELGKRGSQKVEAFDWPHIAGQYRGTYAAVTSGS